MKHLLVKKCGNCDQSYLEIYVDGEHFMSGDDYHDKISTVLDTIEETFKFLDIEYTKSVIDIGCKFGCD